MDEAVAEFSRDVFPETCAKFLHGFVINERELNAAPPTANPRKKGATRFSVTVWNRGKGLLNVEVFR